MNKITGGLFCFILLLSSFSYSFSKNKIGNPNIIYLSPVPGSEMNSPYTEIIIRSKNLLNKQSVNLNDLIVNGSKSGLHSGKIILSDDGKTLIFKPDDSFDAGETVSVSLTSGLDNIFGNEIGKCSFNFTVSKQNLEFQHGLNVIMQKKIIKSIMARYSAAPGYSTDKMQKINKDSLNLPSDFPQLYVSVLADPSPGFIFMSNFGMPGSGIQPYLMILDNNGNPFYYKKMSEYCSDFKLQPNGLLTYYDSSVPCFYGMNSRFAIVDTFTCSKGYETDLHELQILPNGHYLIIADDYEKVDMSKIVAGGDTSAIVTGIIIQEIDKNKNVVWQWRSWDHYKITDATSDVDLTKSTIDYVHTNAIEQDSDGNIMISNRHMDEITKINKLTGDIMWRLGGKNNQFQFINDNIGFSHQHDIRRLANGDITLFDDGNLHWSQLASRAVEYKLDEINKTAELVWQFRNIPDETSKAMGNVQRLDSGNSIIGWGTGRPTITEVTPDGLKEFELSLPENQFNYRGFRFKLDTAFYEDFLPVLDNPDSSAVVPDSNIILKWTRNKFAQSFHLQLSEDSAFTNIVIDSSGIKDTLINIDSLKEGEKYFWRVQSNNNTDSLGGFSGYTAIFNFAIMLNSPDNLEVVSTSKANYLTWDNFSQNADSIIIERKGGCDTVDYKKIAELPGNLVKYTDSNPDLVNIISDKYIYRIKAINENSRSPYVYSNEFTWNITGVAYGNNNLPRKYSLSQNYPNPFNPTTTIKYDIPRSGFVTIKIYDALGKEVMTLVNEYKNPGRYSAKLDARNLASGVYIYRMNSGEYSSSKKLILLK